LINGAGATPVKRSSFRAKIIKRVVEVDSRENKIIRKYPGEENKRLEVKYSRRDRTDAVI
jgi:hypothetical protein